MQGELKVFSEALDNHGFSAWKKVFYWKMK